MKMIDTDLAMVDGEICKEQRITYEKRCEEEKRNSKRNSNAAILTTTVLYQCLGSSPLYSKEQAKLKNVYREKL